MKKYFIFLLITIIFSLFSLKVNAEQMYYINGTDVRMRESATKDSAKLLVFPKGVEITLVSNQVYVGAGCDDGWYNVTYNATTGYVCKSYVSNKNEEKTTYGRPWTTPKKSIVGGAEFIYKNYLSDGQYNSYLKKFNVNPNSGRPFKHQYMTNIAAPSSEARISYGSYSENGLLEQPLVFEIPIFTGMPETTYVSTIKELPMDELLEVKDQSFEDYLDEQGFDETYKKKLRYLHELHPNWIFTALDTEFDFAFAAEEQRKVGAYQNGDYCYSDYNNVEKGWCTPTYEITAMFLDPRNFLSEKYILQFESLFNNPNQTESVVQSILDSTAMSGLSVLDNQTYASIFVEAGNTHNVSPVYLASLARQETSNGTGFSARGESFTYDGIYYEGNLYNFFNIGASSSESNPVLAGLVYASAGLTTGSANNNGSATSEATYIQMLGIKKDEGFLKGYNFGTTVTKIKSTVNGQANVVVTNQSGSVLTDADKIGTGSKLTISDGTSTYSYTIVIKGDITGDGDINSADLLKIRQYLIGTTDLNESFKDSADVNKDGKLNSADLLVIRQQLLGTHNIVQG